MRVSPRAPSGQHLALSLPNTGGLICRCCRRQGPVAAGLAPKASGVASRRQISGGGRGRRKVSAACGGWGGSPSHAVTTTFPRALRPCRMAACGVCGDSRLQHLPFGIHAWGGGRSRRSRLPSRSAIGAATWSHGGAWGGVAVHYADLGPEHVVHA
jgi:hypothetical protein